MWTGLLLYLASFRGRGRYYYKETLMSWLGCDFQWSCVLLFSSRESCPSKYNMYNIQVHMMLKCMASDYSLINIIYSSILLQYSRISFLPTFFLFSILPSFLPSYLPSFSLSFLQPFFLYLLPSILPSNIKQLHFNNTHLILSRSNFLH